MPVAIKFAIAEIGTLRGSLGKFRLSPDGQQPVKIRNISRVIEIDVQANTSTRQVGAPLTIDARPPLKDALSLVSLTAPADVLGAASRIESYGLALPTAMVPSEFFEMLRIAGQRFVDDLKTNCSALFLLPRITDQSGSYVPGFEVSMAEVGPRQLMDFMFLKLPMFRDNLKTAIFMSASDEKGDKNNGDKLFSAFCWLLSCNKLNAEVLRRGINRSQLGSQARAYFSHWYQRQIYKGILGEASLRSPASRKNNEIEIARLEGETMAFRTQINPSEIALLAPLQSLAN